MQAFKRMGYLFNPGGRKDTTWPMSFEESAGFNMCGTALSQLSPKLGKLPMLQKIPLNFRLKRKQVNVTSFLFCTSASHSDSPFCFSILRTLLVLMEQQKKQTEKDSSYPTAPQKWQKSILLVMFQCHPKCS